MSTPGGPKKDVFFPIQSVTFHKHELPFILDVLAENFRNSLVPFGDSAKFKLTLSLEVVRKPRKDKSCPKTPKKNPTPTPPTTGTIAGKPSG
jgi:hypothetical protein